VIELTSSSTRHEDRTRKFAIYRDKLKVKEHFLFDVLGDYLDPPLQGYRLHRGNYRAIRPGAGRLPSQVLGLHLERHGQELRLYDPAANRWLPTAAERQEQTTERLEQTTEQLEQTTEQLEQRTEQLEQTAERLEQTTEQLEQTKADNTELRRQLDEGE
jgi:Uma2 family endonuclease